MNAIGLQNGDPLEVVWPPILLSTIVQKLRRTTDGKRLLSPTYIGSSAWKSSLNKSVGSQSCFKRHGQRRNLLISGVFVSLLFPFFFAVIDFDRRGIAGYVVNR